MGKLGHYNHDGRLGSQEALQKSALKADVRLVKMAVTIALAALGHGAEIQEPLRPATPRPRLSRAASRLEPGEADPYNLQPCTGSRAEQWQKGVQRQDVTKAAAEHPNRILRDQPALSARDSCGQCR